MIGMDVTPNAELEYTLSDTSPVEGVDVATQGPPRKKRCYSGCTICRARKVKCDERPGGCLNCERLQLKCPENDQGVLPPVEELKLPPKAGTKRKKTYRSCAQCRSSKTRCSGDRPRCLRCARKRTECIYDSEPDPAWARAISRHIGDASRPEPYQQPDRADSIDRTTFLYTPQNDPTDPSYTPSPASEGTESLEWLYSTRLPEGEKLHRLADDYFSNIHPLRCFGFIHRPNFMQRLDEGPSAIQTCNALLYIVCALGAKFFALNHSTSVRYLNPSEILAAGDQWAREASRLIFADLEAISVENLMAAVLLHDHELRIGRFASAFMLSGVSARMALALQVNLEYSTDIACTQSAEGSSPANREARRRLMWSCYVMDAWVGSGVDQLTLFNDDDIKVQLPCSERHFIRQKPAITETLEPGRVLKFLLPDMIDVNPAENMGMAAYLVRLTAFRKRVLRFVKHLDTTQPPWLPDSEFASLDRSLRHWYETLPSSLEFTTSAQYIRKDSSQLGALCHLHCTYHQTMCDLYRIGLPQLFKIRAQIQFPPERLGYLTSVQQTCFHHAEQIAKILQTACRHGVKTLADTWLAIIAHDSSRLLIYYLTRVINPNAQSGRNLVNETVPLILSNLEVLQVMLPLFSMSKSLYEASATMLRQSGLAESQPGETVSGEESKAGVEQPTAPATPVQSTPEYVLNPLAIYRLARKSVPEKEKHAPELHSTPGECHAGLAGAPRASRWFQAGSNSQMLANPPPHPLTPQNSTSYQSNSTANQTSSFQMPLTNSVTGFDDLDLFFASNFDTIWQPAETFLESSRYGGNAPWDSDMRPRANLASNNGGTDTLVPTPYSWTLPHT